MTYSNFSALPDQPTDGWLVNQLQAGGAPKLCGCAGSEYLWGKQGELNDHNSSVDNIQFALTILSPFIQAAARAFWGWVKAKCGWN